MAFSNIITRIDQIAQQNPTKICYQEGSKLYTYRALKIESDRVAAFLQAQALPKSTPVIIYGGQTFEMVVTFLGAVKAGHAYIPVDDHSPKERLVQINQVAHPGAVLEISDLPLELPGTKVIRKQDLAHIRATGSTLYDQDQQVQGDENFYIIFTSGTTGTPKGVQISHDNLLSYVDWMLSDFDLYSGIRTLSQASYAFDLSVMDLYPTLLLGGTLVALSKDVTDDFRQLFARLPELKVNVWVSTPSFVEICLLEPKFNQTNYPELNHFLFCGEELTVKTAQALLQRFPDAQVYNTYGPTETTVAVTGVQIEPEMLTRYDRLPIGRVKADTTIDVVDAEGQSLPADQSGELIISGPSVSKGYLNNPEKTAHAFFKKEGRPAYKTGDLGFVETNGLIFYRGRTDFQIKMHGYRIELEDVDQNLLKLDLVKQASTVPCYNNSHKVTQLVAYIVPNHNDYPDQSTLTKAIKDGLSRNIMPYMVPQRIVYQEDLPLTINGKVDRKTLMAEVNLP